MQDERIAVVFEIEFEPLRKENCGASGRPAVLSCKRACGVLEQEDTADLPLGITGNPKTFLVAADEKRGDRLVDDPGIERPKFRGDLCRLVGRRGFRRRMCADRRLRFLIRSIESYRGHRGAPPKSPPPYCPQETIRMP